MRRLLLLVIFMICVPLATSVSAAGDPSSGKEQGQGHDCHKPKPPETS